MLLFRSFSSTVWILITVTVFSVSFTYALLLHLIDSWQSECFKIPFLYQIYPQQTYPNISRTFSEKEIPSGNVFPYFLQRFLKTFSLIILCMYTHFFFHLGTDDETGVIYSTSKLGNLLGFIKRNLQVVFRIFGILISAPVTGLGTTNHERFFVAVCLLWSLNLNGAFQV